MAKSNSTRIKKEIKYPLFKYLQLESVGLNRYTRAYVEEQYRGILKTKAEWAKTLKSVLEGDK